MATQALAGVAPSFDAEVNCLSAQHQVLLNKHTMRCELAHLRPSDIIKISRIVSLSQVKVFPHPKHGAVSQCTAVLCVMYGTVKSSSAEPVNRDMFFKLHLVYSVGGIILLRLRTLI